MSQPVSKLSLGFITVRHHSEHGYYGGYLIVNCHARPLEFHCTMPVKPTRAQVLLYGHTIDDFICGEQIAKALVNKAKLRPNLLLTDSSSVLAFENVGDEPIALVTHEPASDSHLRIPQSVASELKIVCARSVDFRVTTQSRIDASFLKEICNELAPRFDISEPLERIASAILEAHPIAKAA